MTEEDRFVETGEASVEFLEELARSAELRARIEERLRTDELAHLLREALR